ncbi:MAG: hypothetical protein ACYC2H_03085 [Thermoplasmatota archaeon]
MVQDTVRGALALDTWNSMVKASLGAGGLALLAVGPLVPSGGVFPYLAQYAYALGGALVLVAATMRLRSFLIVLGCLALTAGLACTLAGNGNADLNLAAVALYSAAAVVLGAAGRHIGMAVPFVLVPILIVAPLGTSWSGSREAFSLAWEAAVGGPFLLAGLPAAMAVVGSVFGALRVKKWVPVRPSAFPLLVLAGGLVMASLIIASLMPAKYAFVQTVAVRVALISGVLGWVALAYQIGRVAFVWEAAIACLLYLAGALFLDRHTQFPDAFGPTLGITVAASLVPAALAGVGLLARKWMGQERPATVQPTAQLKTWSAEEQRAFHMAAVTAPAAPMPAAPAAPATTPSETPQGDPAKDADTRPPVP